jgi:hypothetical protein
MERLVDTKWVILITRYCLIVSSQSSASLSSNLLILVCIQLGEREREIERVWRGW